jgi:hypothetical protein
MTPPRRVTVSPNSPPAPARRPGVKRRAKRGVIAAYIHEISGRHRDGDVPSLPALRPVD